jgi:glycine oxidase
LAPVLRLALRVPDDHAIDPRRLLAALTAAFQRAGGELRTGAEVGALDTAGGRVSGVSIRDTEEVVSAEQVVVATGPWDLDGIPDEARIPLRPVKGQILRLRDPSGPGLLSHVLRMRSAYIVPRGDGRYVLGATMEERGFDRSVTAEAIYLLLRDASELLPGLGEFVLEEVSAGLRPAARDNAPVIGAGAIPGLYWAAGHYRHGILLAPATADALLRILLGEEPDEVVAPFAPTRFAALPVGA